MFGLNLTATIERPTKINTRGGDREAVRDTTVATLVPCTAQESASPQRYLPGGQVAVRQARVWFPHGTDVKDNDFLTLSDGTKWRVENVIDDAGRGHHLVCIVKAFT